jgi:hypothetical protein
MMHTIRPSLVFTAFVVLLLLTGGQRCRGEDGVVLTDAKTPGAAGMPEALSSPAPGQDRPLPFVLPPPPNYNVDDQGWVGGPLLERPEAAGPGFFSNVESSIVFPQFQNKLVGGQVTAAQTSGAPISASIDLPPGAGMPITGSVIRFTGPHFDPTVSPRIELGYRFPDGFGEVRVAYRFLGSIGSDTVTVGELGPAAQHGTLDIHFVDLDYGTQEFSLGPDWEMRWAVGLRYADVYYSSQVGFLNPVPLVGDFGTAAFTRLTQTEIINSRYFGAHGVFELGRKLWVRNLTLFGRVEGTGVYGRVNQRFQETFVEAPGSTQTSVSNGSACPIVAGQMGLSWDIPNWNHSRVLLGYQYEAWWRIGRGNNDLSFGTLTDQGVFLRAEINF